MMDPAVLASHLGSIVVAIGSLGTAAFGLVDATKIGPKGGISNVGFARIKGAVRQFLPNASGASSSAGSGAGNLLGVLHGNWINGTALADQKAIAKSLIKLQLSAATAKDFAAATGVDGDALSRVAASMTSGTSLTSAQSNVLGRFDLTLTAILDRAYQHADQRYRNAAKVLAMIFAILLAFLGGLAVFPDYFRSEEVWIVLLCGVLATPLAPISKDLASALQAGVKVAQAIKG
jgi:hypothetical protein